jgi:SAM-dependent methyltransferase
MRPDGVFDAAYAGLYDTTYAEKDYEAECDLVEEALRRFAQRPVRAILDLGCGTGGHLVPLARRGYELTGVDLSRHMVAIATEKAAAAGVAADIRQGDIRTVDLGRRFDAVLLMFAVIGYQRTNADVRAAFATIARHLEPGGVVFLDAWYGPGVLLDPPGSGERVLAGTAGPVTRRVSAERDVRRHLCTVRYRLTGALPDGRTEAEEEHVMRFFFPLELEAFMEGAGLEPCALAPMGSLDRAPDERTWNVVAVARAPTLGEFGPPGGP